MSHGEWGALELFDRDAWQAFFEEAQQSQGVKHDGKLQWRPEVVCGMAVRSGEAALPRSQRLPGRGRFSRRT